MKKALVLLSTIAAAASFSGFASTQDLTPKVVKIGSNRGNVVDYSVVGLPFGATIDNTLNDLSASPAGTVHLFAQSGAVWSRQASLNAFNKEAGGEFAVAMVISGGICTAGATGENNVYATSDYVCNLASPAWYGQIAPNTNGGTLSLIAAADPATINSSGSIAFFSDVSGSLRNQGIFFANSSEIRAIAIGCGGGGGGTDPGSGCGDPSPIGGTFSGFFGGTVFAPAINDAGDVLFFCDVSGGSSTRALFLYRKTTQQIIKVAAVGDPSPIGGTFGAVGLGSLNNNGKVVFLASPVGTTNSNIFMWNNGVVTKVAATGDPAPGGGTFSLLGTESLGFVDGTYIPIGPVPDINDMDQICFRAIVSGGSTSRGIIVRTSNVDQWYVKIPDPTPAGGTYFDMQAASINNAGQIAFFADFRPTPTTFNSGWFAGAPGNWRKVVVSSDPVDGGQCSGLAFSRNPMQAINSAGDVLFWTRLNPNGGDDRLVLGLADGRLMIVGRQGQTSPIGGTIGEMDPWQSANDYGGTLSAYTPNATGGVYNAHMVFKDCMNVDANIDQQQTATNYGFMFDNTGDARWQEFLPTASNLSKVDICVFNYGTPGNIIVKIANSSGTILRTLTIGQSSVITGWNSVDLSPALSITPGSTYRIYVSSDAPSPDVSNRYFWEGQTSSSYLRGISSVESGWPGFDFAFITYHSTQPDIDVTPLALDIYESESGFTFTATSDSGKDQLQESIQEFPRGLIIPPEVQEHWRTNVPNLQYNVKDLKASIDWSANDSPVKNQASCGSCWAFSAVALVENLSSQSDLSEQTVVSCTPSQGGIPNDCSGGWHGYALQYINSDGLPEESCYPYAGVNGDCANRCSGPILLVKVNTYDLYGRWGEPTGSTVTDLIALLQSGPVVVAMNVPADNTFEGYPGGIYNYSGSTIPAGRGHSVLIVGYDDAQQYFKVKNSWGSSWGEGGYFRIAFDDVTDDVKFGGYACTASGIDMEGSENNITIANTGLNTLEISSISSNRTWLTVDPAVPPTMNIFAGGSDVVQCNINWSLVPGLSDQATVTITSNDPDENPVYVTVTAHPSQTLAAPILTSPANGATDQPTSLTLDWDASTGATSYRIQVDNNSDFSSPYYDQSGVTATLQTVGGLANNTTYYWQVNASNASDTSPWSAVWHFTTRDTPSLPWTVVNTGKNATIAVPVSINPTLDGMALRSGDAIGAFFLRDGTPVCGGYCIWQAGQSGAVTVFGDDEVTPLKDGFAEGELINYRIWDSASGTDWSANATYQMGGPNYSTNGIMVLASLAGYKYVTQNIALPSGWSMISSYVSPQAPLLTTMMADISSQMTLMKNGAGQVFWPAFGINNIGSWNYRHGYQIHMKSPMNLAVTGSPLQPESSPLPLAQGWNIAAYLRASAMPIQTALSGIVGSMVLAKNGAGQVYWPAFGINTIGSMQPGQGYQMYLTQATTLTYPANALAKEAAAAAATPLSCVHFTGGQRLTGSSAIYIWRDLPFADGDEIAVLDGTSQMAGAGVVHDGQALLVVWGDNAETGMKDGAGVDEVLALRHWSRDENAETTLLPAKIMDALTGQPLSGGIHYTQDCAWVLEGIQSEQNSAALEYRLAQNYPNPFNPTTEVNFTLPRTEWVKLTIYNTKGECVRLLFDGKAARGAHTLTWNGVDDLGRQVPGGIYFLKMSCDAFEQVVKMSLIK